MRAKRSKQYRKLMQHYTLTFSFRPPYQVLLDSGIILAASRYKMRLGSLLTNTLHDEIKPMITQCCIRHLYNYPLDDITSVSSPAEKRALKDSWIEVAKGAERRRCGHHELEEPLSELECIQSVVDPKGSGTNKSRYVVASQDVGVRQRMREVAGVPLVYINRSVMILEPMAARSERVRDAEEKGKMRAGLIGRRQTGGSGGAGGVKRKLEERGEEVEEEEEEGMPERAKAIVAADRQAVARENEPAMKKRKVKGPKGPNPLSVKKTKKEANAGSVARQVEDERSAVRKATKSDPQAERKALPADAAIDDAADTPADGSKRKRKRKHKVGSGTAEGQVGASGDASD